MPHILNSYFLRLECRYTQIQEECKIPQNILFCVYLPYVLRITIRITK